MLCNPAALPSAAPLQLLMVIPRYYATIDDSFTCRYAVPTLQGYRTWPRQGGLCHTTDPLAVRRQERMHNFNRLVKLDACETATQSSVLQKSSGQ